MKKHHCLQLIVATLSSLPQPLNTAPFPTTEAALTLLLAYGDSGVGVGLANDAIGNHISKNDQKQIVDHMIDSIEKYE